MQNCTAKTAPAAPRMASAYREVKIGKTLYRVTSVFTGEKKLGPTLERLAAQRVLDEMNGLAKQSLQS